MDKRTSDLLTASERALVAQTEPARLRELDEDAVGELHGRVRRARNKHSTLYRRQSAAQVVADSSRAKASAKNRRTADKAEVFEDALARTSARLAALARQSAAELRAERLAAAQGARGGAAAKAAGRTTAAKGAAVTPTTKRGDAGLASPASKRATASTRATGARRQAKRDSR